MHRIGLVLLALSLLTVAPTRALVGGCGGGRMGHMEAGTGTSGTGTGASSVGTGGGAGAPATQNSTS